jgi:hypothetical protein
MRREINVRNINAAQSTFECQRDRMCEYKPHKSFFCLLDQVKRKWKLRGAHRKQTLDRFMDKQDSSSEPLNPNLVITITMKKLDSQTASGAGASGDTINNNSGKSSEKKAGSGDQNNNQQAPVVVNQYTKVTMEGFLSMSMSQLSLNQNRQMLQQLAQQGNTLAVNQINANKR